MSDVESESAWVNYWKFHLHTKKPVDAIRIFGNLARRVGFDSRAVASGERSGRPGAWITSEQPCAGTLGDAVVEALRNADLFGDHLSVTPPKTFDEGLVTFCGWISRCNHSELAAVEFELRNRPL